MYQKLSLIAVIFVALVQISGCGENESAEESTVENSASTPASTPAPNPFTNPPTTFDGRAEFNKLARFMDKSVPCRISWFGMDEDNRDSELLGMKSPKFNQERFKNEGLFIVGNLNQVALLANYDWNASTNEGVIYWKILQGSSSMVYRATFYVSGNKLKVGKIEECYDRTKNGDVKTLAYSTDIRHYYPAKNLQLFWESVAINYNK
jgi:hypothetical protein